MYTRIRYSVGRVNASSTYIGGSTLLCQFVEPVTFVCCAYSILCPLGLGAQPDVCTLHVYGGAPGPE